MKSRIRNKDLLILDLLQKDGKITAKKIAKTLNSPITTVFAKIKKLEKLGIIKNYKAVLNADKLNRGTIAFILASVCYSSKDGTSLSQRKIAKEIAKFPDVQEVHIVTGNWDILIKIRGEDVAAIGQFVIDKLRAVEGIEKTLSCMVFETTKETTDISLEKL